MIRVALIDDQRLFREGVRALLAAVPSIQCVADGGDEDGAHAIAETHHPEVMILGLERGADRQGLAVTSAMRRGHDDTRVLVLTRHTHRDDVTRAFAAGAKGYALKAEPFPTLVAAIHAVAAGERWLSPRLPRDLLRALAAAAHTDEDPLAALSAREREVFALVIADHSTAAIAEKLGISPKTVETHRTNLNRKLDAHSTADLLRCAMRFGLT